MSWLPGTKYTSIPSETIWISSLSTRAPSRGTTSRYSYQKSQISPRSQRVLVSGVRMLRSHCTKRSSRPAGSFAFSPRWTSETKYVFVLSIYANMRTSMPTMAQ